MDSCVGQEVSSHIACEIGLIVGMSGCAVIVETYLLGGGEHLGEVVKVAMVDYEIHRSRMVVAVVDEYNIGVVMVWAAVG